MNEEFKIIHLWVSNFIELLLKNLDKVKIPSEQIETGGIFIKHIGNNNKCLELDWKHLN